MIYSNKFLNFLLGLLSLIAGVKIIYTKRISQGNAGMGGGDIFLGNTAYIIGSIFISLGILALYFNKKYQKDIAVKCPKCKETFNYKDTNKGKCPHCKDVDTIDVKEYYKKYPEELKEETK